MNLHLSTYILYKINLNKTCFYFYEVFLRLKICQLLCLYTGDLFIIWKRITNGRTIQMLFQKWQKSNAHFFLLWESFNGKDEGHHL